MIKAGENCTVEMNTEAVDIIASQSLKWHLSTIEEFMTEFEKEDKGHPEDFVYYTSLASHIREVLKYYGH